MSEHRTIKIEVYRTPSGEPTCASDFTKDGVCAFLLLRRSGLVEVCGAGFKDIDRVPMGIGYLVPVDGCPVWAKGEDE